VYVCSELDELGENCIEWVSFVAFLPDLSIEDALTLASAIVVLWALAWAWRTIRSAA